jgi:dTMP kinase
MTQRAYFITFEGGEASGKSTNLKLITEWLTQQKIPHISTHEPGGTPLAEDIRNLLLHAQSKEKISEETELLLMFASRAQHVKNIIEPALAAGQWVVCSRFSDSSYAYQGGGRGIDAKKIAALETLVHPHLQPDLTILLDVPVEVAFERSKKRVAQDRIEQESREFFEKVRAAYLKRAKEHPERLRVIDASQPLEAVTEEITQLLKQLKGV